jgi:hypothetical protein
MKRIYISVFVSWIMVVSIGIGESVVLKASKDNFGRSNKRNRNNGASETLLIANAPNIRTLIAFDLSSITNEIISAELRFRQQKTADEKMTLTVAPMVDTEKNANWGEGQGNVGVVGQNALVGESSYQYSVRDVFWESAQGDPLVGMSDPQLWESPIATLNGQAWQENRWLRFPISDVSLLENRRKGESLSVTFGVWGKSGRGLYFISSRNSAWSPELHLVLKEDEKK